MGTAITPQLEKFVSAQTSFFLGTADADGQPYIQHRGGPPGFLRVLDPRTLGFADFSGNRQYVTVRNLEQNPRAYLFLIDYAQRRRIKLRGVARVESAETLIARLMPAAYTATPERAIVFTVATWEANCSRHIPQRVEAAEVAAMLAARDSRIAELEAELVRPRKTVYVPD